jgi:LPS export ABC transporter protein LptC
MPLQYRIKLEQLAALSLTAILLAGCENDIRKVKLVTERKNLPLQTGRNIEVIYSDSAKVKVRITAPFSQRFETPSPYIEFPKGVKAVFYTDSLKIKSTLTANYAVSKEHERTMEAKGNVVVVNEREEQLNTEHLIWDEAKAKIYSSQFVKITTPDKIIYGEGFEADQDFNVYKIFNIKGTISVKKDAEGS